MNHDAVREALQNHPTTHISNNALTLLNEPFLFGRFVFVSSVDEFRQKY